MLARRSFLGLSALALSSGLLPRGSTPAQAADTVTWKAVVSTRLSRQYTVKWAWMTDELAKQTGGRFKVDVVSIPELGMTGAEMIRALGTGLLDAGDVVVGYVSGELPILEGVAGVGVYENLDQAHQAYEAWMDEVAVPHAKQMGGRPISSLGYTSLYLWSKFAVNNLEDMKGKKVRIFSQMQSDYVAALGATPISLPISEVYSSLDRGVIDGVVTGPEIANGQKYHEVASNVTDLMFGPGSAFVVVSEQALSSLPADLKTAFDAAVPQFRKLSWEVTADDNKDNLDATIQQGIKPVVPVKPEWVPQLKKIAQDVVIPGWVKRAGPDGAAAFNKVIAPIVGFSA